MVEIGRLVAEEWGHRCFPADLEGGQGFLRRMVLEVHTAAMLWVCRVGENDPGRTARSAGTSIVPFLLTMWASNAYGVPEEGSQVG